MTPQNPNQVRNDVGYGRRTFDLSTARDEELVALPMVTGVTVLKAEDSVQARFGDDSNADVELQDLDTINFDNPIDQLYLTNEAGSGELQILVGREGLSANANVPDEIDVVDRSNRDLGTVDVSDRSGREVGKVRVEDSSGTLIDPATNALEDALQSTAAADQDPFLVQEDSALDVSAQTVPTEQQTPIALEDDGGTAISTSNPLSVDAPNTLPVEQQTPVGVENSSGTQIDPATETTVSDIEVSLQNWTNLAFGQDSVTTSGTAVALNGGTSQNPPDGKAVSILADNDNTGTVYIGDSTVTTSNGRELDPGTEVSLAVDDVANIHIDADNDGDGVSWIVEAA